MNSKIVKFKLLQTVYTVVALFISLGSGSSSNTKLCYVGAIQGCDPLSLFKPENAKLATCEQENMVCVYEGLKEKGADTTTTAYALKCGEPKPNGDYNCRLSNQDTQELIVCKFCKINGCNIDFVPKPEEPKTTTRVRFTTFAPHTDAKFFTVRD